MRPKEYSPRMRIVSKGLLVSNGRWLPKRIHVISLGAGVQSSALALMAANGEFNVMPIAAIFADTGCEELRTYRWLDKLEAMLPFPVIRVSAGNLGEDFLNALRLGSRCSSPPFFVRRANDTDASNPDALWSRPDVNRTGILWRKCTLDYKIRVIRREIRKLREKHRAFRVDQWIGISWDEAHRMRDSGVGYIRNRYPLVDRWITRKHCMDWMLRNGYEKPPKSACYFCPYHGEQFWQGMKRLRPEEFSRAVRFEREIHRLQLAKEGACGIFGRVFLHRSGIPLDETSFNVKDRTSPFGNECEGMCGV